MTANEIAEVIENNKMNYNYFGIRSITKNPITHEYDYLHLGDEPSYSYSWDDGNPTDNQLNGTCALNIGIDASADEIAAAINELRIYRPKQIVLLGSNDIEYGQDNHEIVMRGNVNVLAEWMTN